MDRVVEKVVVPSFFTEDETNFPTGHFMISLTTAKRGFVLGTTVGPPIIHLTAEVRMPETCKPVGVREVDMTAQRRQRSDGIGLIASPVCSAIDTVCTRH